MNLIVVFCTCGSEDEASRLAQRVVETRLAACVNILPPIRSIYRWEGKVESSAEHLLLIKTAAERFEELRKEIRKLHSYETPEIIAVPVSAGDEKYMNWVSGGV